MFMFNHFKIIFVLALVEEWKKQLGNYIIDYDTLTIVKVIAEGARHKFVIFVILSYINVLQFKV